MLLATLLWHDWMEDVLDSWHLANEVANLPGDLGWCLQHSLHRSWLMCIPNLPAAYVGANDEAEAYNKSCA